MKNGVTVYTNIPPPDESFKRVILPWSTPKSSSIGKSSSKPRRESFKYSKKYDDHIKKAAIQYAIDPYLVKALVKVESNFNSEAVSPKGAIGVMQLMPGTAKDNGVSKPFDPAENIRGGVKYLKRLMSLFKGNLELALAGYNAGENAVIKYGYKIPPYSETVNYVEKVLTHYDYLKNNPSVETGEKVVKIGAQPK